MITHFYKILYKKKNVVYVGVTTRNIEKRFNEHIKHKSLDPKLYSVVEFDRIDHGVIDSLESFYKERLKVYSLEQKYIKCEKENGSNLLNVSKGGEWGQHILDKLLKKEFLIKYGNYDLYLKHKNKLNKIKMWLNNWVLNRSQNKTKVWLRSWINCRSINRTKAWLKSWIFNISQNKTKVWLKNWIQNKSQNKTKKWLRNWVTHRSQNKTKAWLMNWVNHRSQNKTKVWLRSWVFNRSTNKITLQTKKN